ncbi:MAG: hypothetical protein M1837_006859 [Sclerophora amabilis]|nr:MAG: hypothetical protein M1837_006859 [Sclerophora amabilis]
MRFSQLFVCTLLHLAIIRASSNHNPSLAVESRGTSHEIDPPFKESPSADFSLQRRWEIPGRQASSPMLAAAQRLRQVLLREERRRYAEIREILAYTPPWLEWTPENFTEGQLAYARISVDSVPPNLEETIPRLAAGFQEVAQNLSDVRFVEESKWMDLGPEDANPKFIPAKFRRGKYKKFNRQLFLRIYWRNSSYLNGGRGPSPSNLRIGARPANNPSRMSTDPFEWASARMQRDIPSSVGDDSPERRMKVSGRLRSNDNRFELSYRVFDERNMRKYPGWNDGNPYGVEDPPSRRPPLTDGEEVEDPSSRPPPLTDGEEVANQGIRNSRHWISDSFTDEQLVGMQINGFSAYTLAWTAPYLARGFGKMVKDISTHGFGRETSWIDISMEDTLRIGLEDPFLRDQQADQDLFIRIYWRNDAHRSGVRGPSPSELILFGGQPSAEIWALHRMTQLFFLSTGSNDPVLRTAMMGKLRSPDNRYELSYRVFDSKYTGREDGWIRGNPYDVENPRPRSGPPLDRQQSNSEGGSEEDWNNRSRGRIRDWLRDWWRKNRGSRNTPPR